MNAPHVQWKHGKCGCGRTVKPQRAHHDPKIWPCMVCAGLVCDDCYHMHFAQKHAPAPRIEES